MAGTCRPDSNIYKCGKEMTSYTLVKGDTVRGNGSGLIDQSAPNDWQGNTVAYWDGDSGEYYVTFKFNKPCYIWRCGTSNWASYTKELRVTNLDTNEEVTSEVNIKTPTAITNSQWEKFAFISTPGTYKFWNERNNRQRLDSEWFFEEASKESEIIKNKVKDAILNNELFQEYCVPYTEE